MCDIYIYIYIGGALTQRVHVHYCYGIRSPNHNGDGLSGANSIIVVYMDPLGNNYLMLFWGFLIIIIV